MSMRVGGTLLLFTMSMASTLGAAEPDTSVAIPSRIRIVAPPTFKKPTVATQLSWSGDTLVVRRPADSDALSVPLASVGRLEYSAGHTGGRSSRPSSGSWPERPWGRRSERREMNRATGSARGSPAGAGAVFLGTIGAGAGLMFGLIDEGDKWEPVDTAATAHEYGVRA